MKVLLVLFLILSTVLSCAAQKIPPQPEKPKRPEAGGPLVASTLIAGTWKAWPLADSEPTVAPAKALTIDRAKVQSRIHTFSIPQIVSAELCSSYNDSDEVIPIADDEFVYRLTNFTTYEVKGRVFAYEVIYNAYVAEDGTEVGTGHGGTYVDNEGRGEFRITCAKEDSHRIPVPNWIKSLAAGKKQN
jgi:hypothetical protein